MSLKPIPVKPGPIVIPSRTKGMKPTKEIKGVMNCVAVVVQVEGLKEPKYKVVCKPGNVSDEFCKKVALDFIEELMRTTPLPIKEVDVIKGKFEVPIKVYES